MEPANEMSSPVVGQEWVVEAFGCDPSALADPAAVRGLFDRIVRELGLHPVDEPHWHVFPPPSGITALLMLAESHLTCHTFPEHGSLCLNLFCCTPRPGWDWEAGLAVLFGADRVEVRRLVRAYASGVPVP